MKIAASVNPKGDVVDLLGQGLIRLYDNQTGDWDMIQEIPFHFSQDQSFSEIKAALRAIADKLGDCSVLLSASTKGFLYALLQEEYLYRIWKSSGSLVEQLNHVAIRDPLWVKEQKELQAACAPAQGDCSSGCCSGGGGGRKRLTLLSAQPIPERLGPGYFRVDLAAFLADHPESNSKDALAPILEEKSFKKLEILCDHLPRWLKGASIDLGLAFSCQGRPDGLTVELVTPVAEA